MWAIETKHLPPTNNKGRRIRARFGKHNVGMSVILSWDFAMNSAGNHRNAAEELRRRMVAANRWRGILVSCPLIMGDVGDGFVFVFDTGDEDI